MLTLLIEFILKNKMIVIYSMIAIALSSMTLFIRYQSNIIDTLQIKNEQLKEYKDKYITLNSSFIKLQEKSKEIKEKSDALNIEFEQVKQSNDKKTIDIIKKEYTASCKDADDAFNAFIK